MEIFKYPAEILRQKVEKIQELTEEITTLAERMIETMYEGRGIGLAGPQVGKLLSLFIAQTQDGKPEVFINPEITATSLETELYEEGCLSLPGLYADVMRPSAVTVQAWNEKGRLFKRDCTGLLARIVQHEMDHLKGVLFIDYLSEFKRERLLKSYGKKQKA